MKALFLINRRSGPRRGGVDVGDLIPRHWRGEHEIVGCERKEDLDAIVDRAEAAGFDVAFAVGGDGTVHELAKRLVHRRIALGIIPTGSGNGMARHLGIPMDAAAAIAVAARGEIVDVDSASVNGIPFVGVMGLGFDAEIAARFAESHARGLQSYVQAGLTAYSAFTAHEYEITTPETTVRERALVVAVANSAHYGNNARIAPIASIRDGLLDVVIVREPSIARGLLLIRRLFDGTIHLSPFVTMLKATSMTIHRAVAGPAHLDGEPVTLPADLTVQIHPRSLRVLVPQGLANL